MEIIAGLLFSIFVIVLIVITHKKEKPVVIQQIAKKTKVSNNTPKKNKAKKMKKTTDVKINLPYDLMNEPIFQGYVRWFYYYEQIITSGNIHREDIDKIQTRYINMKSNLMVRITDRKDGYLNIKYNGDYDLFFAECKKLNDWIISDDIAKGKGDAWSKIVEYSDKIEIDSIVEGKSVDFVDPKLNYEYRNSLCIAMFNDIGTKMNEDSKKKAMNSLYEMGYSKEDGNKIIEMINNGSTVEEAVECVERDADFQEIFKEKDILENDPIAETVDVDQLLEEWGLQ